jgi:hypothetical protein
MGEQSGPLVTGDERLSGEQAGGFEVVRVEARFEFGPCHAEEDGHSLEGAFPILLAQQIGRGQAVTPLTMELSQLAAGTS